MRATPMVPTTLGNRWAEEGLDRCTCGSKYWEHDRCVDCGTPVTMRARRGTPLVGTLYGGVHFGTPSRPNANPVLSWMRDDDLTDPWGTAMAWAFAVCDYLWHVALCDDIPEEIGYSPAATVRGEGFEGESWPDAAIVEMAADTYTLIQAARILHRYLDWCKAAGKDY